MTYERTPGHGVTAHGAGGAARAAVLGANDGIISTASLIMGVAASSGRGEVLLAGMAGLAAKVPTLPPDRIEA